MSKTTKQQHHLYDAICLIKSALQHLLSEEEEKINDSILQSIAESVPVDSAFSKLVSYFSLNLWEQCILLLCCGIQLDSEIAALCARLNGGDEYFYATMLIACHLFNEGRHKVLSLASPLHAQHLLIFEKEESDLYQLVPMHVDESVLQYLIGETVIDSRLQSYIKLVDNQIVLTEAHQRLVKSIQHYWQNHKALAAHTVIRLTGGDGKTQQMIADATCRAQDIVLYRLYADRLPNNRQDLHRLVTRLNQHSLFCRCAYFIDWNDETANVSPLRYLLDNLLALLFINDMVSVDLLDKDIVDMPISAPSPQEQIKHWQHCINKQQLSLDKLQVIRLVTHFNCSAAEIGKLCTTASALSESDELDDFSRISQLYRQQHRRQPRDLIKVIPPSKAGWQDLILPEKEQQLLQKLQAQIEQQYTVYQQWGFTEKISTGLGVSALFAGDSGTGKTFAARIIANQLMLDIYQIDLSSVIDKYIGESEKRLEKIFTIAEKSGAILLFDEADALFGKRSQVENSKDRYANIGVSYLLQRMESYRGLSILTTNFKQNIDDALMRRLRFVIEFPFPRHSERQRMWQCVFPKDVPLANIDYQQLANLPVAGGAIRNIALNAAFLAANDTVAVTMQHLLAAARYEYKKQEKTLTQSMVEHWE